LERPEASLRPFFFSIALFISGLALARQASLPHIDIFDFEGVPQVTYSQNRPPLSIEMASPARHMIDGAGFGSSASGTRCSVTVTKTWVTVDLDQFAGS
jgi:hypothetical protein